VSTAAHSGNGPSNAAEAGAFEKFKLDDEQRKRLVLQLAGSMQGLEAFNEQPAE
jgi:hypothetical protein